MNAIQTLLAVAGPLLGVLVGGWLTDKQHTRAQRHQLHQQLRTERLAAYTRFITAARMWQSNILEPDVRIVTAHTGSPYADGGDAFGETIRGLIELRLVADRQQTVLAATVWERALRALSEARAASHPAPTPRPPIDQTKEAETAFITAARQELTPTS